MSKCHVIIELHCMGVSNSMIIKQLKVPKSTVCDTVARFKELDDDKDCPRSGCPCTARTPKIIKTVLLPTCPEKLKHGAEPIFRVFGARKCGPLLQI